MKVQKWHGEAVPETVEIHMTVAQAKLVASFIENWPDMCVESGFETADLLARKIREATS